MNKKFHTWLLAALILFAFGGHAAAAVGDITTIAGNGTSGFSGDNGQATSASLNLPHDVAVDSSGNIYIADRSNARIRKVGTDGVITTVAGTGTAGFSGDNGQATSAMLNWPNGVAVDSIGNIYIGEAGNDRIRKVATDGVITTFAGNGTAGFSGDGGQATSASLYDPARVAVDSIGNVYIAEYSNHRIRKVATDGVITTVAGNGTGGFSGDTGQATSASLYYPSGVAVDSIGNIYIADYNNNRIRRVATDGVITTVAGTGTAAYSGDNGPATSASLNYPSGVAIDSAGNIYISDTWNNRIRKVATDGVITTFAGKNTAGFSGDGGQATSASLWSPQGVAVDSIGNVYIADFDNQRIRKVQGNTAPTLAYSAEAGYVSDGINPATGTGSTYFYYKVVYTDADNDAPSYIRACVDAVCNNMTLDSTAAASLKDGNYANGEQYVYSVSGLAVASHNYYFETSDATATGRLPASGSLSGPTVSDLAITTTTLPDGNVGVTYSTTLAATGGTAPYTWWVSSFALPSNLTYNSATGEISGTPASTAVAYITAKVTDSAAYEYSTYLWLTINPAPDVTAPTGTVTINSGAASTISQGVVLTLTCSDLMGCTNMRFSNDDSTWSSWEAYGATKAWAMTSGDGTKTVYAQFKDAAANVSTSASDTIALIPTGDITTIAGNGTVGYSGDGGQATSASLNSPHRITVDSTGSIYIADFDNHRIRKVATNGVITTVAGNGTAGFSGDGGQATSASLYRPSGVAIDSSGNVYIADSDNHRVRKVATDGVITTVAGDGLPQYSGDGGQATSASLNFPNSVAIDSIGNVYISDMSNHRIRKVATDGVITTFAGNGTAAYSGDNGPATSASLNFPTGVAVDSAGNIYIGDRSNNRIRKVATNGVITTVAGDGTQGYSGDGGQAASASLNFPRGVAVDSIGNVYISDVGNNRIRKVATDGVITTVAGNGTAGFSGDNGPATSASLNFPGSVAVDSIGNIYITDRDNQRIRKVGPDFTPPAGTISINSGAATTTSTAVTLTLSCTDTAGCSQMRFSNDNSAWSSWETYAASKLWTLTSGYGTKTVYVQYKDGAGNSSASLSDDIVYATGIDLAVSVFSAPGSAVTGVGLAVANTVANQGAATSVSSYIKFYLSTDAAITTADTYLGQRSVAALAGGAASAATTTFTLPVTIVPGAYYLGAIADANGTNAESNESNNTAAQAITITSGVDLSVSAFSAPATLTTGAAASISSTVANTGTSPSRSSPLKLYLSADSSITTADTYLGQRSVSALAGGASSAATTNITLPVTIVPGVYYIGAIADANLTNAESNEANNTAAQAVTVISGVDLTVSAFSAPASITTGAAASVSTTVANTGTSPSKSSYVKLYLSADATITTADTYLGQRSVSALAAGGTSAGSTAVTIPVTVAPGAYYIGAIADGNGTNAETSESNNTASQAITVTSGVDLSISAFSAPASMTTGAAASISTTVANTGTSPSKSSTMKLYLSTDATITTADTYLGSRSIAALAAGASSAGSTTVTIPVSKAPGAYYIGAIADAAATNTESDESNNTASQAVTIISGVDLSVSAFSAPALMTTGAAGSVSTTVANTGTSPSASSTMKLYLSTDATITTADTYLGSRSVAALAAGGTSAGSTTVTIPVSKAPGVYYIGAIADAAATNTESDESNNTASQAVTVISGVDLTVSAFSAPATMTIGAAASVSSTVSNGGTSASASSTMKLYLSTDATITTADRYLGSRSISALAAGASSAGSTSVTISASVAPGAYYIGAIADVSSTNAETNESNNTASQPVTVAAP